MLTPQKELLSRQAQRALLASQGSSDRCLVGLQLDFRQSVMHVSVDGCIVGSLPVPFASARPWVWLAYRGDRVSVLDYGRGRAPSAPRPAVDERPPSPNDPALCGLADVDDSTLWTPEVMSSEGSDTDM